MTSKAEAKERKLVKSARAYQQKSLKKRETLAAAARKAGVSAKVFKRALQKPSKTIRKHEEVTKIRRAPPSKTAAAIEKTVKLHKSRALRPRSRRSACGEAANEGG